MKVVVVGAGSWGSAFAAATPRPRARRHARRTRSRAGLRDPGDGHNPRHVRDADLGGIAATLAEAPFEESELVVVAVPSRVFGGGARAPGNAPILSLTKGLDPTSRRAAPRRWSRAGRSAVLSGPNIMEEIVRGLPAAAVVASEDLELAVLLQVAVNSATFRVYQRGHRGRRALRRGQERDRLAAGGPDGLGLGDNAKAALVSRGSPRCAARRRRRAPGHVRGPRRNGDLIVTSWAPSGRNAVPGELIARGATADEAVAEIGMVVEGLTTAPVLRNLSRLGSSFPSPRACAVLDETLLTGLVVQLMSRAPTAEK